MSIFPVYLNFKKWICYGKSLMAQSAPPVISNGDVEGSNPPIPQQSNYQ